MTQPDLRRIPVSTNPPCDLYIGAGASRALTAHLAGRPAPRVGLVSDSNVAGPYARPLLDRIHGAGVAADLVVIEAGEASKTRATKQMVEDRLISAGLGRDGVIVAVGGGVVSDLAGFVAATYMRGVRCLLVPTSLLAMVDASIGGKTGVNHPMGKNLIGAFHQPEAVFIDTDCLTTLPDREFVSGLAELIKAGVVGDADLFARVEALADRILERDAVLLAELVASACAVKSHVVQADAGESDLRKILNFGHTIGHALETLSGYSISHGEAVAIGMVAESRIAVAQGLLDAAESARIEGALDAVGLPVRLPGAGPAADPHAILAAASTDKKSRGGRIACALPCAVGRMARGPGGHGIPLDVQQAADVLAAMVEGYLPR